MPISLHAALVPSWLQILQAGKSWLRKASQDGFGEAEIAETRLIDDMLPFAYQVKSMAVHSRGAIKGVRKGVFGPDMTEVATTFAGMHERLDGAIAFLDDLTESEIEEFVGRPMRFEIPKANFRLEFTADQFLLSFSQPNFYFHASTAYDILRMKGLDIGKREFLGPMRIVT